MRDLVIVNPAAAHGIYGELGNQLVAKEPPLWARLLAGYVRDRGFSVEIIDAEALNFGPQSVASDVTHPGKHQARLVCVAVFGHQPSASTQQMDGASMLAREIKRRDSNQAIIMVGGHVAALPERTLREEAIDFACNGEGPLTLVRLLRDDPWEDIEGLVWRDGQGNVVNNVRAPMIEDLDKDLHGNTWDLLPMNHYRAHNWQCFGDLSKRQPYASIYTTLNCPYKCLRGDTLVNTILGPIPIKRLAEDFATIPVYTYDRHKKRVLIAPAINIRKYGSGESLVRVQFDDGSHIDCTPDHRFLGVPRGRYAATRNEFEVEAQHLIPGASVRAIKWETETGYRIVSWGRRKRQHNSRMIMEYFLGRELTTAEQVHHINRNTLDDSPTNLYYAATAADHFMQHPEISERMITNNPAKNMTPEWREKIGKAVTGKVRSHEQRLNYRASKLGDKNPNYKDGRSLHRSQSRIAEINHRVVSVTPLAEREDVYCLEVPGYDWFFANDVLVHNCSFCCISAPFGNNRYLRRSPQAVVEEIKLLYYKYGVETLKIVDEMFVLAPSHYMAIAQGIIDSGLGKDLNIWAYARVDTVKPDTLKTLRQAGFQWLALGIESGSKHVRDGTEKALKTDDIVGVVRSIQSAGINVIGNYIFGLPDDDLPSMQSTLDLALLCQTEFANFYSTMAYPGSRLYDDAVKTGKRLPATWRGFSQHNDDCTPMDTEHVDAATVLRFRDEAFTRYFTDPNYLAMIEAKFGKETLEHVKQMTTYRLKRKLLDAA